MAISNLSVVSVPVSDQDRAKAFYVGQLGFTEQSDTTLGEGMRWVMLRPPGAGLGRNVNRCPLTAAKSLGISQVARASDEVSAAQTRSGGNG